MNLGNGIRYNLGKIFYSQLRTPCILYNFCMDFSGHVYDSSIVHKIVIQIFLC